MKPINIKKRYSITLDRENQQSKKVLIGYYCKCLRTLYTFQKSQKLKDGVISVITSTFIVLKEHLFTVEEGLKTTLASDTEI